MKNYKKYLTILIGTLLLICIAVLAYMHFKPRYRSVKLEEYEGAVSLTRQGKTIEPYKGVMLIPQDMIETMQDSFASLFVDNDKHLGVKENTRLSINATGTNESGKVTVDLSYGEALFEIENKLNEDSTFEVLTPNAVLSVRGTTFEVVYDREEDVLSVNVLEGTVAVNYGEDLSKHHLINAGESVTVTGEELSATSKTVKEINALLNTSINETTDGSTAVLKIAETEVDGLIHMPYYEYDYSDVFSNEMDLLIELLKSNDEKAILTTLECKKDFKDYASRIYDRIAEYAIYQDNGGSQSGYFIYYKDFKFGIKNDVPSDGGRELQFALIPENGRGYCFFTRYYNGTPIISNIYISECSDYIFNGSYEGYMYSQGQYGTITGNSVNSWADGYAVITNNGEVKEEYFEKGVSEDYTYHLWCFDGENVWTLYLNGEPEKSCFY